jgi:hypothetical protein
MSRYTVLEGNGLTSDIESPTGTHLWTAWPVNWSATVAGALGAIVASLVFGLIGTAVGATSIEHFSSWKDVTRIDVAFAICAAFFAYVIGGWIAGKITGATLSEHTILHGALAYLVATPVLVVMIAAGAGSAFGGWYGGLAASPIGAVAAQAQSPDAVRGAALAAVTALLVALVGSVIGGWMASGEPMTFTHHRTRPALSLRKGAR